MMKVASISETRQQLSSFLKWVKTNQQDVVIQNRGQAEAVMIPFADYDLLLAAREKKKRQEALERLQAIAHQVQQRNKDLTEEEADAIADEITRDAINSLVEKGIVRFQK